ncbi:MAG: addiction module antidote protein, HigA family [Lachnospiraceae bacterium]|nr:addiction module antidote protein, HigA family [Lachnospiraceae bacterium]
MAVKKIGISRDLLIHPGETIAEVLELQEITQAELAARAGVSAAYVCNVIAGKKGISTKFAMGLEYALGVSKSFWLNLQANYDAELLEWNEKETITEEEKEIYDELKEVVEYLQQREELQECEEKMELILPLRRLLKVSNLANLKEIAVSGMFRLHSEEEVNPYVMGAWIRLCQMVTDTTEVTTKFIVLETESLVEEIKLLMREDSLNLFGRLKEVMAKHGISFAVMKRFSGAPVQGYLSQKENGIYQMALTVEETFPSTFWFALFHEIGHIVNGDVGKLQRFLDDGSDEKKEQAADLFAREKLSFLL